MKNKDKIDLEAFKKHALKVMRDGKKYVKAQKEASPDDWDRDYNQLDKDMNEVIKLVKKF